MESQGERVPGGLGMCSNLEPMALDGTTFCNFKSRGSSTPYPEHGLCRQTGSRNGGTIAPQRGTEQAAIYSAANGTTQGERSQQPFQATRAWQADIGGLWEELKEEWRTELEKRETETRVGIKTTKGKNNGKVKTVRRTTGRKEGSRAEYL